ncbi:MULTISPECIES: LPS export ABC transporter periplasmic protein LptC [unclassified Zymobacter]|uniref:LPS export ABC transporter periplasmic protein LptC n=1 Tax=unclassified Zymobacter TaxID=3048685 RepID=UPI0039C12426
MIRWIRDNTTRVVILFVIVLVGIVLAFVDQFNSGTQESQLPSVPEGQPDYVLEQANFVRFDAQGKRYQSMTSPHVAHMPDAQQTTATDPRIDIVDDAARLWNISGQQATMTEDGTRITLSGNAKAVAPSEQWRLETATLNYDRGQDKIWSDTDSRFFQADQTMRSDRFEALLTPKTVTLTGNVQGVIPPTARQASSDTDTADAP